MNKGDDTEGIGYESSNRQCNTPRDSVSDCRSKPRPTGRSKSNSKSSSDIDVFHRVHRTARNEQEELCVLRQTSRHEITEDGKSVVPTGLVESQLDNPLESLPNPHTATGTTVACLPSTHTDGASGMSHVTQPRTCCTPTRQSRLSVNEPATMQPGRMHHSSTQSSSSSSSGGGGGGGACSELPALVPEGRRARSSLALSSVAPLPGPAVTEYDRSSATACAGTMHQPPSHAMEQHALGHAAAGAVVSHAMPAVSPTRSSRMLDAGSLCGASQEERARKDDVAADDEDATWERVTQDPSHAPTAAVPGSYSTTSAAMPIAAHVTTMPMLPRVHSRRSLSTALALAPLPGDFLHTSGSPSSVAHTPLRPVQPTKTKTAATTVPVGGGDAEHDYSSHSRSKDRSNHPCRCSPNRTAMRHDVAVADQTPLEGGGGGGSAAASAAGHCTAAPLPDSAGSCVRKSGLQLLQAIQRTAHRQPQPTSSPSSSSLSGQPQLAPARAQALVSSSSSTPAGPTRTRHAPPPARSHPSRGAVGHGGSPRSMGVAHKDSRIVAAADSECNLCTPNHAELSISVRALDREGAHSLASLSALAPTNTVVAATRSSNATRFPPGANPHGNAAAATTTTSAISVSSSTADAAIASLGSSLSPAHVLSSTIQQGEAAECGQSMSSVYSTASTLSTSSSLVIADSFRALPLRRARRSRRLSVRPAGDEGSAATPHATNAAAVPTRHAKSHAHQRRGTANEDDDVRAPLITLDLLLLENSNSAATGRADEAVWTAAAAAATPPGWWCSRERDGQSRNIDGREAEVSMDTRDVAERDEEKRCVDSSARSTPSVLLSPTHQQQQPPGEDGAQPRLGCREDVASVTGSRTHNVVVPATATAASAAVEWTVNVGEARPPSAPKYTRVAASAPAVCATPNHCPATSISVAIRSQNSEPCPQNVYTFPTTEQTSPTEAQGQRIGRRPSDGDSLASSAQQKRPSKDTDHAPLCGEPWPTQQSLSLHSRPSHLPTRTSVTSQPLSRQSISSHYDFAVVASSEITCQRRLELSVGVGSVQGRRRTMEDEHFSHLRRQVDGHESVGPVSLVGVLDGHNGTRVAQLAAQLIPHFFFGHSALGENNALALVESVLQADEAIYRRLCCPHPLPQSPPSSNALGKAASSAVAAAAAAETDARSAATTKSRKDDSPRRHRTQQQSRQRCSKESRGSTHGSSSSSSSNSTSGSTNCCRDPLPSLRSHSAASTAAGVFSTLVSSPTISMMDSVGGSTLIMAAVHRRMLYVACLGDARAVLYDGQTTTAMSEDHKPSNEKEVRRIEGCGGVVLHGRVCGALAVSRALGDFEYKCSGDASWMMDGDGERRRRSRSSTSGSRSANTSRDGGSEVNDSVRWPDAERREGCETCEDASALMEARHATTESGVPGGCGKRDSGTTSGSTTHAKSSHHDHQRGTHRADSLGRQSSPPTMQRDLMVSNVADVRQINLSDASHFLILACDGLWDVVSNEEATQFVKDFLCYTPEVNDAAVMRGLKPRPTEKAITHTLNACCQKLAEFAVESGSMDNVSVMVLFFHDVVDTVAGLGGVRIPDTAPSMTRAAAAREGVTECLIESSTATGRAHVANEPAHANNTHRGEISNKAVHNSEDNVVNDANKLGVKDDTLTEVTSTLNTDTRRRENRRETLQLQQLPWTSQSPSSSLRLRCSSTAERGGRNNNNNNSSSSSSTPPQHRCRVLRRSRSGHGQEETSSRSTPAAPIPHTLVSGEAMCGQNIRRSSAPHSDHTQQTRNRPGNRANRSSSRVSNSDTSTAATDGTNDSSNRKRNVIGRGRGGGGGSRGRTVLHPGRVGGDNAKARKDGGSRCLTPQPPPRA